MIESICCVVHENIYLSILCVSFLYISFIAASLCSFFKTLSWADLASYIILFILLCLLGGRLLLLNAGLSKDVYYETQSYAEILISEKPDLLMTFPFIQKIENPGNVLNKTDAKNIPVNIYCNKSITELQCTLVENFIMDKISAMGESRMLSCSFPYLFRLNAPETRGFFQKQLLSMLKKTPGISADGLKRHFPVINGSAKQL